MPIHVLVGARQDRNLEETFGDKVVFVPTSELPHMTNANMQFDNRTLEPVFKLIMGEAGSSFTFEVAQKNGIPYSLVNRAKKKIERGKVRFDATIAKLQKERKQMMDTGASLKAKESKASKDALCR